ncbi:hypothetical protein GCM10009548_78110 [Streptomyces malaysiensis subsp. malaysiensis]
MAAATSAVLRRPVRGGQGRRPEESVMPYGYQRPGTRAVAPGLDPPEGVQRRPDGAQECAAATLRPSRVTS